MVFKVVGNATPGYVGKLWDSSSTHSENVAAALDTSTSHLGHYKNRIVLNNHWQTFHPKEVYGNVDNPLEEECDSVTGHGGGGEGGVCPLAY